MRILIASSHEALAHAVGEIFEIEGYTHEWHKDPDQALAYLGAGEFDVLLVDHEIGPVRGATLAQEAREANVPALRIVLMARHADIGTQTRVESTKLDALLAKPFDRAALLAAVRGGSQA